MTEYRHIPGVTSPGYVQRPDGAYVPADSPYGMAELAALRARIRRVPEPPKVIVYSGVPRCPWDGSAMPYTVFAVYDGYGAPSPGYLFECEICGWEDEIS